MTPIAQVPPASPNQSHVEWVDALRGLSALAVVLFHVRVSLWVGWNALRTSPESYSAFDRAVAWLALPLPFFGSAVMLFFLISGFCVHFPHAAGGRPLDLRAYAWRRAGRIYPPYLAAVLLGVAVEAASTWWGHAPSSPALVLRSAFMVQNFSAASEQMASNPSLWSLPVEVELYLAYPLFYWLCTRGGLRPAMGVAALASAITVLLDLSGVLARVGWNATGHFSLYWAIWCAGAWLAERARRGTLPRWRGEAWAAMLLSLLAALASHARGVALPLQHLAWATFYFLVLWWGLAQADPLRRVPGGARRALRGLGQISYSLYLIHFPFFALCGAAWAGAFGSKPSNLLVPLAFSALCLPLALLFYRIVEAPSHHLSRALGRAPAATGATAGSQGGEPPHEKLPARATE